MIQSISHPRIRILFAVGLGLVSYGFSNIRLTDIELAIIKKDFHRAQKFASEFIARNPKDWQKNEATYFLGVSQLSLERYSQAREIFQELLKADIDLELYDKAKLGVIDSYDMSGEYETALALARELFKERPESKYLSLIYLKIARTNLRLARWEEAKMYLEEIVDNFPNSPEHHSARQLLEEKQYFAVQVGSFLEQKRAQGLAEDLKRQGHYAYIVETLDRDGQKYFRVRVGQLSSLDQAEALRKKLSKLGYPTIIYP